MSESRRLFGVVMDPIETIKPKKDSTLAMLLAAQRAGWAIVYFRPAGSRWSATARRAATARRSRSATTRDDGSSSAHLERRARARSTRS